MTEMSKEDKEFLVEMYNDHHQLISNLARFFGRSDYIITNILKSLGVHARSLTETIKLRATDFSGMEYGRLKVISGVGEQWLCICKCGTKSLRCGRNLRRGKTLSCSCLHREKCVKHGLTNSNTFKIWGHINTRCFNKKCSNYMRYGGRGIEVCERWRTEKFGGPKNAFQNFLDDMGERPSKKHSIHRIDNDGPYSPENCMWATGLEQGAARSSNRNLVFRGKTQTVNQWARETKIPPGVINHRLKSGWPVEKILTTPTNTKFGYHEVYHDDIVEIDGKKMTANEWAKTQDVSLDVIRQRMNSGKSFKEALLVPQKILHGHSGTPTHDAWERMYHDCYNPLSRRFKYYGGKNPPITICERWREPNGQGFINFLSDLGPRPSEDHFLTRVNSDSNFSPGNCFWRLRHNKKGTPTYDVWRAITQYCYNKNCRQYPTHGALGITVQPSWREPNGQGFLNFLSDMGEKPSPSHKLTRLDKTKDFSKENCEWKQK